jgi:hypothetical protein
MYRRRLCSLKMITNQYGFSADVTLDTDRRHTPSTNEIVLLSSGLTCNWASFLYNGGRRLRNLNFWLERQNVVDSFCSFADVTDDTDCGISDFVTVDRTRTDNQEINKKPQNVFMFSLCGFNYSSVISTPPKV